MRVFSGVWAKASAAEAKFVVGEGSQRSGSRGVGFAQTSRGRFLVDRYRGASPPS